MMASPLARPATCLSAATLETGSTTLLAAPGAGCCLVWRALPEKRVEHDVYHTLSAHPVAAVVEIGVPIACDCPVSQIRHVCTGHAMWPGRKARPNRGGLKLMFQRR